MTEGVRNSKSRLSYLKILMNFHNRLSSEICQTNILQIIPIMEKFMLIIREDLGRLRDATEREQTSEIQEMFEWTKALASSGKYLHSEPLDTSGRYVSKNEVLSDGPFIEAKEGIAGYYMIMAKSIAEAVSVAQTCPLIMKGEAVIEIRPVFRGPTLE